jgi:hypothetical protein
MSKKIFKVVGKIATVVAAAALVATGVGAVLLPAGFTFAFAGVAVGTIATVAGAVAAGASLLMGKPKGGVPEQTVNRLSTNFDLNAPRKAVFGTTAFATDLRYQAYTGTDQEYLHWIVGHACHAVESIDEIWFDTELAWSAAGGIAAKYAGYLTVTTRTEGTATNPIAIDGAWSSNARLTGCAYTHFRFKLTGNSDKAQSPFASSVPTRMTVKGKGMRVPDVRLPGVDPADQTTWVFGSSGDNPAWQELAYLLGWKINGQVSVGRGVLPARTGLDSFVTAANLNDEPVVIAAGGTEPRYRAAGVFTENDSPSTVLGNLNAAMNAVLRDAGGKLALTVLHNDLGTPIAEFSEDDILGDEIWKQTAPLSETFNIVRGRYVDPSNTSLFQLVDYPEVTLDSPDGINRIDSFDLALVQSAGQAQRLAKQRLQRAQYQGVYSATFNARAWQVSLGDVVSLSHAYLGWSNKLFRVTGHGIAVDGRVPMVLVEEHPDIYAWDAEESPAVEAAVPTQYDPLLHPWLQAFDATQTEIDEAKADAAQAKADAATALANANAAAADVGDAVAASEAAQSDAAEALAKIDAIVSDSVLSRAEKPAIIRVYTDIVNEQSPLVTQATDVGADPANLQAKQYALAAYLGSLTPAWNDLTQDTPIVGATFRAKFNDYYAARTALLNAMVARAATTAEWDGVTGSGKDALIQSVERISSDGWLSASEKPALIREYDRMVDYLDSLVVRFVDLGSPPDAVDERDAAGGAIYVGQPNSLGTYLANTLPTWNDTTLDTQIPNIATYNAKWTAAIEALNAFAAALVGTVPTDVQAAIDELVYVSDDGYWTPLEKAAVVIPRNAELEAAFSILDGYANAITDSAVDAAEAAAEAARTTWINYRGSVTPAWNDATQATAIDRTTARNALVDYQAKLDALAQAIRAYTDIKATTALDRVNALISDNILSRPEKYQMVMLWQELNTRYNETNLRRAALGYPAGLDAPAIAAQDAIAVGAGSLAAYLGSLTPAWNDSSQDTVVDGATMQSKWNTAYEKMAKYEAAFLANPNADVTSAAIAAGVADSRITSAANTAVAPYAAKTQQLDSNGRFTSRRGNTQFSLGGAQQVYVTSGALANPLSSAPQGNGYHTVITVAAHSVKDDIGTISYSGGSISYCEPNTTYFVWEDDEFYAGGTRAYNATTSATDLAYYKRRFVGAITTGSGAAGSPSTGGSGGGAGGLRQPIT